MWYLLFLLAIVSQLAADSELLIEKKIEIPELGSTLIQAKHKASGMRLVHLHAPHDPENFFCIAFTTLPTSSNGAAHILEHVVLEGSKKYPSKGLFVLLQERSFATYLNAFTAAESTCFVASSTIPKDFYNILDVYLDAAFHPLITPLAFAQEGFRKELIDDETVAYKGVVYNEMKGALASPYRRLTRAMYEELFPDTFYRFNAGGDPAEIATITHDDILSFHKTHYKPTNCVLFLYGDIPFEQHVAFLEAHLPQDTSSNDLSLEVPLQNPLPDPVRKEYNEKTSEDDERMVGFGWLTTLAKQREEVMALVLLDAILMGSDVALLKQKIIESGLFSEANSQVNLWHVQVPYLLSIEGCKKGREDELEALVRSSLESIAKEGIPRACIDNAFHLLELALSSTRRSDEPFGMTLFERLFYAYLAGGDFEEALLSKKTLQVLFSKIEEEPRYLENLLERFFIHNPHFVRISFDPKVALPIQETDTPSDKEKKSLREFQKQFMAYQNSAEVDSFIPAIALEDIIERKKPSFQIQSRDGQTFFLQPAFTNGVTHADLVICLPEIDPEDLWIMRLLCTLAPDLGLAGRSFEETIAYVQKYTGGINGNLRLFVQEKEPLLALCFSASALHKEKDKLFEILSAMTTELDLSDKARVLWCIQKMATNLKSSVETMALEYTMHAATGHASSAGFVSNQWFGFDYYKNVVALAEGKEERFDAVYEKLQILYKKLQEAAKIFTVVSDEEEVNRFVEASTEAALAVFPVAQPLSFSDEAPSRMRVDILAPVAFNAIGCLTPLFTDKASAPLAVAAALMSKTLHTHIRERGGAYGGRALYDMSSGHFYMYSYRDPNVAKTFAAFEVALEEVLQGTFSPRDLEEAKLKVLQRLEAPVAATALGMRRFREHMEGKTERAQGQFRSSLINVDKEAVIAAVQLHLAEGLRHAPLVTFAGKSVADL